MTPPDQASPNPVLTQSRRAARDVRRELFGRRSSIQRLGSNSLRKEMVDDRTQQYDSRFLPDLTRRSGCSTSMSMFSV